MRVPGRRTARRRAGLVLRARPLGRRVAPRRAARLVRHRVGAAARASRCGSWRTAWRRGCSTGAPVPAGGRHGPSPLRARAPRRGGRRRGCGGARARLLPLVAGGQLRVGHLRAPLRPLRGGPQRPGRGALHGHRRRGRRRRRGVRPGRGRPARPGTARSSSRRPEPGRLSSGAPSLPAPPAPAAPRTPPCPCAGGARRARRSPGDEAEQDVRRDAGRLLHLCPTK